MSVLSREYFHDEEAAFAKLESIVWPDGPTCPHCGNADEKRIYKIAANPEKRVRYGLHKCAECRKQFTAKVGTVFEHLRIPLYKALQAVYLMCASKKGISANQLSRVLEVTPKTAWFLAHRIREAMRPGSDLSPLGGEGKTVEADETFIGGKEKNRHKSKRAKRRLGGNWGKETVFSLVEREGHVRSVHTPSVTAATLRPILVAQLDHNTKLMTDDAGQYRHMHRDFDHEVVNHSAGEYVRGEAHTNTVEGYFSILKRGITGTYHHVSQQHLKRYLAEFDFRYNNRKAVGVADNQRTDEALKGIVGKRLTYQQPSA